MNTQHTPGPWNLHPHYDGAPMAVERRDGSAFVAWDLYVAQGEKVIANVIGRTGNCGWPHVDNACELKANARLVAAAPELLAVARSAIEPMDALIERLKAQDLESGRIAAECVRRDLLAAIAKAEGQS